MNMQESMGKQRRKNAEPGLDARVRTGEMNNLGEADLPASSASVKRPLASLRCCAAAPAVFRSGWFRSSMLQVLVYGCGLRLITPHPFSKSGT